MHDVLAEPVMAREDPDPPRTEAGRVHCCATARLPACSC